MPSARVDDDLGKKLRKLKGGGGVRLKAVQTSAAAGRALTSKSKKHSAKETALYDELQALADYIHAARAEIAAINPGEVKDNFLPDATDELDAVIEAAAEATNAIMDAAESIEGIMGEIEGQASRTLMDATTSIYEACGFQDITGQRITKVINTLKSIEEKVDALVAVFADDGPPSTARKPAKTRKVAKAAPKKKKPAKKAVADKDLLNGPGKKGEAKTQDEIDALLASFD
ncbi:MAG: protein phosphatase CheZ [Rhodospirillales bacterium]